MAVPLSRELAFTKPTVHKAVYITTGPSGWSETFKREEADAELTAWLKPVAVADVVKMYLTAQSLRETKNGKREPEEWTTIVGFLARTTSRHHWEVPHVVAIAFWGKTLMAALGADESVN